MAAGRRQADRASRKVGNILICAGIATPIIGIAVTKFVSFDSEIYVRVIQSVFIAGALLSITGILVRSYWTDKSDSTGRPFDTTGLGCAFMTLSPFICVIGGITFFGKSEKAVEICLITGVVCILVGFILFQVGDERKAALDKEAEIAGREARPPYIIPGRRPEGFLLVDEDRRIFEWWMALVGIFTVLWCSIAFLVFPGGRVQTKLLWCGFGLFPLVMLIRIIMPGIITALSFEKRAELILPRWPPESGEEIEMSFQCRSGTNLTRRLGMNLTAMSIDADIQCSPTEEETKTITISVRDLAQSDGLIRARWTVRMPILWPLPSVGGDNEVRWKVKVTVTLAQGPKGISVFPLLVVSPGSSQNEAERSQSTE